VISRPEKSYRVWCVEQTVVISVATEVAVFRKGCCAVVKKNSELYGVNQKFTFTDVYPVGIVF